MLGHCLRRWPVTETLFDICILIIKCVNGDHRVETPNTMTHCERPSSNTKTHCEERLCRTIDEWATN